MTLDHPGGPVPRKREKQNKADLQGGFSQFRLVKGIIFTLGF
jgi:hypothetical protein